MAICPIVKYGEILNCVLRHIEHAKVYSSSKSGNIRNVIYMYL